MLCAQESSQAAAELLKRQEELERKAAELDRREREMQSLRASGGPNEPVNHNNRAVMFVENLHTLTVALTFS